MLVRYYFDETNLCPLGYTPNKTAAIVAGVAYIIVSVGLFIRLWRRRDWWGLCLPIGTLGVFHFK